MEDANRLIHKIEDLQQQIKEKKDKLNLLEKQSGASETKMQKIESEIDDLKDELKKVDLSQLESGEGE